MTGTLVICLALMEITGQNESFENKSPIFMIYQFIMPAVIWYFGMRERKKLNGGKLTYKQALYEGFKISLVFGLTSPFVFAAYYLFINPPIIEYVKTAYGMPAASDGLVISIDLFAQFIAAIIFGTLYASIIALFVRSKSK